MTLPDKKIPYGRQQIDSNDIDAVIKILKSNWLTTGPTVEKFEKEFSNFVGSKYAICVNSGTAALHASLASLNLSEGDEVLVPAMTFAATSNSILYCGGTPVFVDVNEKDLLISVDDIKKKISDKTKAIITVDYAGQSCDYESILSIANDYNLKVISDSCHSLGGRYNGMKVGNITDMSTFSFHPVKNITTGEGGMVTTNNEHTASFLKSFRNHGIDTNHFDREKSKTWYYEMNDLGFNYRLTDFQSALGIKQLKKLPDWIVKRQNIANYYDQAFSGEDGIDTLSVSSKSYHAYHLYVIKINFEKMDISRVELFDYLNEKKIGVNVHYIPVYHHPYYKKLKLKIDCPNTEKVYKEILSIPIFPELKRKEMEYVSNEIVKFIGKYA